MTSDRDDESGPGGSNGDIPLDTAIELLSREHRRIVIDRLARQDRPVELAELADEIARRAGSHAADSPRDTDSNEIYLSLYHSRVPQLANAGMVSWDTDVGTVAPTERGELLRDVQRILAGSE